MMGKRVNFAARSVISPDPFIGAGEIGVPPYFASRLSYPEYVTPWNVERLRRLVERGNDYPGAVAVEDDAGPPQKRSGLAKRLLTGCPGVGGAKGGKGAAAAASAARAARAGGGGQRGWVVYRHLMDGDVMLTNRQPTLHKPGLMAHKARVLRGERAIRLHYSNCSTFNADFDGDEINLHLPQDQYGRAEGYGIVHADQQYIVPTDGKPIRGLIQDHVVSGVLLTKKDCFLTAEEFSQLLLNAASPWRPGGPDALDLRLPIPAVLKPVPLWTGKQLLSSLVAVLARGRAPLTFTSGSKVPADYWGRSNGEGEFIFWRGELLAGTLDKAQFGKFGLVHAMQELYGCGVAGEMLSALSRLLTLFLQWHGFTCGMDDLLLRPPSEDARQAVLRRAEAAAIAASAEAAGKTGAAAPAAADLLAPLGAGRDERAEAGRRFMSAAVGVSDALGERYRSNRDLAGKMHDMKVTSAMHPLSSEAIKACIPSGQVKPFPSNCMSLMTVSGAKGSLVNFSQIAVLLGQQELEGRRVPRMASGKTLPCFRPFDGGARSGGFVGDRFLTGLRPQEYYFHCMAGREGLVDTTVKTSRSGYLQRCLVKNLEALRVAYDGTVRDACDGSVVQFYYGEDGLDVMATSYLRQHGFIAQNAEGVADALDARAVLAGGPLASAPARAEAAAARRARAKLVRKAAKGDAAAAAKLAASEPVMSRCAYFPSVLGATSEAFSDALERYAAANPDGLLRAAAEGGDKEKDKQRRKSKGGGGSGGGKVVPEDMKVDAEDFSDLLLLKFMRSLAAPGEAVGVIAAQSIGEPSTQMTLNTFHMAGRGEANVTLGIPRLREILLTAAARIKTPTLTLPLRAGLGEGEAALLRGRFRKLRLAECLKGLSVEESPFAGEGAGSYRRLYRVVLQFHPVHKYPKEAELQWEDLVRCFNAEFMPQLRAAVAKAIKRAEGGGAVENVTAKAMGEGGGGPAPGEDDEGGDPAAAAARGRRKSEKSEAPEDHEEDEELREGKLRFRGGRGEAATYDGNDEDDDAAAAEAERELRRRRGDEDDDEEGEGAGGGGGGKQQGRPPGAKRRAGGGAEGGFGSSVDGGACVCEAELGFHLRAPKLLMLEIAERVAAACVVRQVPGIERVHVLEGEKGGPPRIQTEGINFVGVWEQASLLDVDRLTTNDVHAMLVTYGVEAARATILREVSAVFGAYGIGVDARHLSLIADFMTHTGGYRPCNRMGIDSCTSPLLKMSFETAARFLTDASLSGTADNLKSPAARLCVGGVAEVGTGCCDVLMEL
ncbi:MAG: hypothetical protein J3K34DRAFT_526989 [Monoraphidium minutum]|nr:MAG: hypothetical protein J3K34DRAFT_526989 [Monoraphidium minutum]